MIISCQRNFLLAPPSPPFLSATDGVAVLLPDPYTGSCLDMCAPRFTANFMYSC